MIKNYYFMLKNPKKGKEFTCMCNGMRPLDREYHTNLKYLLGKNLLILNKKD
jgi:hypothetical protein